MIRNNCDDCSHQVIVGDAFYLNIRAFHSNERTRATRCISCLSAIARLKAHAPIVHMQAILLRHSHSPHLLLILLLLLLPAAALRVAGGEERAACSAALLPLPA